MSRYLTFICLIFVSAIGYAVAGSPKNVIIFIGDGMGFEQVKAAGMFANGQAGTLSFESLPHQAECKTHSANKDITDSAAAGTAIATGRKVNNGVISTATPGDGSELETILEFFKSEGRKTGLVTTAYISHSTPACFAAHADSRTRFRMIINDYLTQTRPNVLMGGAKFIDPAAAAGAGYTVVDSRSSLQEVNTDAVTYLWGQFGKRMMPYEYDGMGDLPHLSEMTAVALDILDNDPNGFFLMVEGALIDYTGHGNDLIRNIHEVIEFSNAVKTGLDWLSGRSDTLIIVTADHETGGLKVLNNNGKGNLPDAEWAGTSHTPVNVPVFAVGPNADLVHGILDNTDIFRICTAGSGQQEKQANSAAASN